MEPWISWGICLTIAGGVWLYYSQRDNKTLAPGRARANTGTDMLPVPTKSTKKGERARRKQTGAATSDLSSSGLPATFATISTSSATDSTGKGLLPKAKGNSADAVKSKGASSGEDPADKAWAEQMAKARKGTNLSIPTSDASRTRTVKPAVAAGYSPAFSSASSTGGADADDDLSPALSPSLRAGDVSDMLEPRASGPSVLRLTTPQNTAPQRAPRAQKEFQAAETKKQRQNRRKNEERKAANQESEQSRQTLLETQRRTAREARGEPARNGLQQGQPPSNSAWSATHTVTTQSGPAQSNTHAEPTKDIVDRTAAPALGNAQASVVPLVPPKTAASSQYSSGMSEQEQFDVAKKLSEDESGWSMVNIKKSRKQANEGQLNRPVQTVKAPRVTSGKVANGFAGLDDDAE